MIGAISTSKFDNIGGWITSLPVRCDGSIPDGRPKGLPQPEEKLEARPIEDEITEAAILAKAAEEGQVGPMGERLLRPNSGTGGKTGPKRIIEENGRSFDPSAPAPSGLTAVARRRRQAAA